MKIINPIILLLARVNSFVPFANRVIRNDMNTFHNILDNNEIPCHLSSARVKTFESARTKLGLFSIKESNVFKLYDLIGFKFVFYTEEDLYYFFKNVKREKFITYVHNYIKDPKDNGYKSLHFHYRNRDEECPIQNIECQLYTINSYYDSVYGKSSNYKDYKTVNSIELIDKKEEMDTFNE